MKKTGLKGRARGIFKCVISAGLVCAGFVLLVGCNNNTEVETQAVDFHRVHWYAKRANAAYDDPAAIREAFPDTVHVATVEGIDVQYFIEHPNAQQQIISIRGTYNLDNAKEDAEYLQSFNSTLGIYVHDGFDRDAQKVLDDLRPFLQADREVVLTGHSLGAAISTLLMMYLDKEGFRVAPSINFGQPKVTDKAGIEKYAHLRLMRVVDENDVVPLLPPLSVLDSLHGAYAHMGTEVILLEGKFYVYEDMHLQRLTHAESFWDNITDVSVKAHFMKHYLHNINSKLHRSEPIAYAQRKQYIDN
ncbi:lipase family protein [Aestuariibacter halophilus]|uniref:Lipase family protein n=1 Tax=Fluctibacter halophilus TaxID=226011 RepID=A0ABS8G6T4_9ALTE|nr:lipase family protein [Aestuariibacter halophilus]MCC2615786.1 lipase family protein [Aestuariibacter halophilus]